MVFNALGRFVLIARYIKLLNPLLKTSVIKKSALTEKVLTSKHAFSVGHANKLQLRPKCKNMHFFFFTFLAFLTSKFPIISVTRLKYKINAATLRQ